MITLAFSKSRINFEINFHINNNLYPKKGLYKKKLKKRLLASFRRTKLPVLCPGPKVFVSHPILFLKSETTWLIFLFGLIIR